MDVIHTDAPLMPLTQMIGGDAHVIPGEAAGGRRDCFYGWGEAMADAINCKPHNLVIAADGVYMRTIAEALVAAGHQVVVTDYEVWSENQRVFAYDDHHQH